MRTAATVCYNVRNLLIARGMNYQQLCEIAKCSKSYAMLLKDPEKFNPTLDVLDKLAKALKVRVRDLINPELNIDELAARPSNMHDYSLTLTDFQRLRIQPWLEANKRRIKMFRLERMRKYEELAKS